MFSRTFGGTRLRARGRARVVGTRQEIGLPARPDNSFLSTSQSWITHCSFRNRPTGPMYKGKYF